MTAVVPITTSPSAVTKTIRAIRPTGSRTIARTMPSARMNDEEMPEPHRNPVPLERPRCSRSLADRSTIDPFAWIMTRSGVRCQRRRQIAANAEHW